MLFLEITNSKSIINRFFNRHITVRFRRKKKRIGGGDRRGEGKNLKTNLKYKFFSKAYNFFGFELKLKLLKTGNATSGIR